MTTEFPPSSPLVKVNVPDLLSFFDEKPDWAERHATAVVGVAGEDLNTACFCHYLESRGHRGEVLADGSGKPLAVSPGTRKGSRLDRWIEVRWKDGTRNLFQTEIKNWSAHSLSGEILRLCASDKEVRAYKQSRWENRWDRDEQRLRVRQTSKVLSPMRPPSGCEGKDIQPLLIFWEALGLRDNAGDHLFSVDVADNPGKFPKLWVFSVSSYLRSVKQDKLELMLPEASHRLAVLRKLFAV